MNFSVNSPILFVLAGIIIFAVLAQSVFFLVRAVRRSKEIGMDQQKLRKTMITAGVFTIAPAVAIVISVITLSKDLGLPLPWLRLSVVGSLSYETIAATNAETGVRSGLLAYGLPVCHHCLGYDHQHHAGHLAGTAHRQKAAGRHVPDRKPR